MGVFHLLHDFLLVVLVETIKRFNGNNLYGITVRCHGSTRDRQIKHDRQCALYFTPDLCIMLFVESPRTNPQHAGPKKANVQRVQQYPTHFRTRRRWTLPPVKKESAKRT